MSVYYNMDTGVWESKYLVFVQRGGDDGPRRKTEVWNVLNKDRVFLGEVKWYGPWRQYCFVIGVVFDDRVFAASCLADIAEFCRFKTKVHMESKKKERSSSDGNQTR